MAGIFQDAHDKATVAAKEAAQEKADKWFGGQDGGACGFAWVKADVDGRSKAAKELKKVEKQTGFGVREGFRKAWNYGYDIWDPAQWAGQSIDVKEAGAAAYAKVMQEEVAKLGFKVSFYAQSRLD